MFYPASKDVIIYRMYLYGAWQVYLTTVAAEYRPDTHTNDSLHAIKTVKTLTFALSN